MAKKRNKFLRRIGVGIEYFSDTKLKGHDNLISLDVTAVTFSVKEL